MIRLLLYGIAMEPHFYGCNRRRVRVCVWICTWKLPCFSKQLKSLLLRIHTFLFLGEKDERMNNKKKHARWIFVSGVKIAKFNSFYYNGLIPEITNKERYAQQSHQTNDNEYHKKRNEETRTRNFNIRIFLVNAKMFDNFGCRHHANDDTLLGLLSKNRHDNYCVQHFFDSNRSLFASGRSIFVHLHMAIFTVFQFEWYFKW